MPDAEPTSDERTPLIRPSDEDSTTAHHDEGSFAKNLKTRDAFTVLVTIIIGSGVFSSPGAVDANVPSPGAALSVWLLGGVLVYCGATTLAELGTAIPGEGGIQPYLTYVYGPMVGFLAAWSWILATMPATLAILSIAFVDTISSAAGVVGGSDMWSHKLFSILTLIVVTAVNCISTKASTRLSKYFVIIKLLSIALLVLTAVIVVVIQAQHSRHDRSKEADWRRNWFHTRPTILPNNGGTLDWTLIGTWELLGHLSAALYSSLWAYSGWDKSNYIVAELSHPSKQLPLAINTAIPLIILCYIASNAAYYFLLPWKVVSTTDSAAITAMDHTLGKTGAIAAVTLICLVVFGSLLGNSFVTGRMTVAASKRNWLPKQLGVLGKVGSQSTAAADAKSTARDTPMNALILSAAISSIYILIGNFRVLLTFNGLGEYFWFFFAILGDIILRFKEPHLNRPYKPFILIPIVFAFVSGFVYLRGIVFAPVQAAILAGIWIFGAAYYIAKLRFSRPTPAQS